MINKREDFLSDRFALEHVKAQRIKRKATGSKQLPPEKRGRFVHAEMQADEALLRYRERDDFSLFHSLEGNLNAYERDLLEQFLLHMGPEAVRKHAQRNENEINYSPYGRALGITFERLAAISLTEILHGVNGEKEDTDKLLLLDPGSASRVFGNIYDKIGIIPDGALIQVNPDTSITLKHLIEYKLNPRVRQSEVEAQIAKLIHFLEAYGNQTIITPEITFDTKKRIKSNRMHVSESACVFLVFPSRKQEIEISNNRVFQIHAPFDTEFVKEVAAASLHSGISSEE